MARSLGCHQSELSPVLQHVMMLGPDDYLIKVTVRERRTSGASRSTEWFKEDQSIWHPWIWNRAALPCLHLMNVEYLKFNVIEWIDMIVISAGLRLQTLTQRVCESWHHWGTKNGQQSHMQWMPQLINWPLIFASAMDGSFPWRKVCLGLLRLQ